MAARAKRGAKRADTRPHPGHYSRTQFAMKLGVSPSTVYRWERAGKIKPPRKLLRNDELLYTDRDLRRYRKFTRAVL